ncbi:MAG: 16S rRNA (cytosine(1402)-N(4))-methyltransferase RsmH [bacterium]|nr:16S rRNA (cytosine(1402)-N(4))-methyltransferase RsmH [bacterium]
MHEPVLLNEVINFLDPQSGEFFIDGTSGAGGHSAAIKERIGAIGMLLSIDWEKSGDNYADLPEILQRKGLSKADGLLLDLGFSSDQLGGGKGFSFNADPDEPLLMTYDANRTPAKQVLKELSEHELAQVLKTYGEERYARPIAASIKKRGRVKPVETVGELVDAIMEAVPRNYERGRINPATRTFMALRIYVNQELENLESALQSLDLIVKPGGRIGIISFHSLEDRLVKNYFRDLAKANKLKILTKKPIVASPEEISRNPRSRSAKLRVAMLLAQ